MADSDSDSSGSGVRLVRLEQQASGAPTVLIPSDLPIQNGMISVRPQLQSMLSEITLGVDAAALSDPEPDEVDEDDVVPKKGFHTGGMLGRLPIEEELSLSDDEYGESSDDDDLGEKTDSLDQYEKFKGVPIMKVTDHMVNDHYGDSGWYTGSVTADAMVPHGKGMLLYANSRIYDGEWELGKWYGLVGCIDVSFLLE